MEEKKNNQKTLTIVLAIALAVCAILAVVFGVKSNKVSGLLKESTEEAARLVNMPTSTFRYRATIYKENDN